MLYLIKKTQNFNNAKHRNRERELNETRLIELSKRIEQSFSRLIKT